MFEQELRQALRERVERSYEAMRQAWLQLTPGELIEEAGRISATSIVRAALADVAHLPQITELMKFADPLEVIRDAWEGANGINAGHKDEMAYLVWEVLDRQSAFESYELAPDGAPVPHAEEPEQGVPGQGVAMC